MRNPSGLAIVKGDPQNECKSRTSGASHASFQRGRMLAALPRLG